MPSLLLFFYMALSYCIAITLATTAEMDDYSDNRRESLTLLPRVLVAPLADGQSDTQEKKRRERSSNPI